ncbi:MAG TPA: hypothetical protein VFS97_00250 [Nitrososphaeraceae archaeon]|nr:hypothetical protein [Nitrososphaeraceae archaeon]
MIESKKNTLKMTAIVVAITIVSNVLVTLALQMIMMTPSDTTAFAQKTGAKLKTTNTVIKATNVANVIALCEPNNKLLSGGYTIGDLSRMISDFNDLRIYDSRPIRTQSGQEGWLISAFNPERQERYFSVHAWCTS